MVIEARFGIPDERMLWRLLSATALVGFGLEEPRVAELCDRYPDTADGAFRTQCYAYRIRQPDSPTPPWLKGLGVVSGAIHHRTEPEAELPETLSPRDWPYTAARELALHLGICPVHITPLWEMRQ